MGICKSRYFMVAICLLQMCATIQRQVFDFLGFLWVPILLNFFEIVFIIFGFFGLYQYRLNYIVLYSLWHVIWLGWNIFIICLYMDWGGISHKDSKILKLDPDSGSWWQNGPGCKGDLNTTLSIPAWENIKNCLIDYRYVEVFQAAVQCFLAAFGMMINTCLIRMVLKENGKYSSDTTCEVSKPRSLYSIEFSQPLDRPSDEGYDQDLEQFAPQTSPKPMTPRRVKRRSIMTRGLISKQNSTRSRRNSSGRLSTIGTSKIAQNPVIQLLDQQRQQDLIVSSNCMISFSNNNGFQEDWQCNGHSNPTYQQSSMQSLHEPDEVEELYNNRPASARSSYSNFHGARSMAHRSYFPNQATPQVPQKRCSASEKHKHSSVFLNSGPPAYSIQCYSKADSETVM